MLKKLQNYSACAFVAFGLLCSVATTNAQDQTALKQAARVAKVSPDLLPVMTNRSAGAPLTVGGLQMQNEYVIIGNSIAIEATATNQNGQALLNDLQALGLTGGVAFKGLVFGYMPMDRLDQLKDIPSLTFAYPSYRPETNVGAVTTQGDVAVRADIARTANNVTGAGTKVGILSDSYNNRNGAAAGVASGDLPAGGVQVVSEYAPGNGSDEGRAMAELVHDVAPGASIAFATAFGGQPLFAQNILRLAAAGCNIIVDDVINLFEPFFQDGIVAQAADQVVNNNNVTYFSSAGNQARSSYQAGFVNSGLTVPGIDGIAHDFGGGDIYQRITVPRNGTLRVAFQWDNPFRSLSSDGSGATADLDIFFLRNGAVVGGAAADNLASGEPAELTGTFTNTTGAPLNIDIVIVKYAGADPSFIKWVNFGSRGITIEYDTKSGASFGHSNSSRAISVGATGFFDTPAFNPNLTTAVIEPFSSAGGTPIYFTASGARLPSPIVRQKPEITCVDGGNTTFFTVDSNVDTDAFPNFFGTSAAAPHAAAVAALMQEKAGNNLSSSTILSVMQQTALDMDDPVTPGFDAGFDFGTGFGYIQADRALQAINTPSPLGFAITGVTTVSCVTVSASERDLTFTPQYAGLSGQPVSFSVANEFAATTAPGPYTVRLYADNPVITLEAAQSGTPGKASFVYNWLAACESGPTPSPSPAGFAIAGVTTISCVPVSASERNLTFTPQYAGLNGQPVSFSVANESAVTTVPGPYTIRLYTDNPVVTLEAAQSGTPGTASFVYNWLAACGGNGRLGAGSERTASLQATVLPNPVTEEFGVRIEGAAGKTVRLQLSDVTGRLLSTNLVDVTSARHQERLRFSQYGSGLYFLRVSTAGQSVTLKVIKQ